MNNILIFGGTFDPPHYGHLKTVEHVLTMLPFDRVFFLPCKQPVSKAESIATPQQRVEMLKLLLHRYKQFRIDLSEIKRDTPSYMITTLQSLKKSYGEDCELTLMIGTDALMGLDQWYQWEQLLKYCNLLVIKRSINTGTIISEALSDFISKNVTNEKNSFLSHQNGLIYFLDAGRYDISSTNIRQALKEGKSISNFVPIEVENFIKKSDLYI